MRFCPWYPLTDADGNAPSAPGVFQVRVADGLLDYPTGKSAMIYYGADSDVRGAVAEFRQQLRMHGTTAAMLCRHTIEMTPAEATAAAAVEFCRRLIREFFARFGSPPRLP